MTRKIELLHMQEPNRNTYKVTTKFGSNEYDDINKVVAFLEMNRIESFTVIQDEDNDITDIIQSILIWRK